MKWRYFGYGIIISCLCAFVVRVFVDKDKPKNSKDEVVLSESKKIVEDSITVFHPLTYVSLSDEIKKQFKGNLVSSSGGVVLTGTQENIDNFKVILKQIDFPLQEYLIDVLILSVDTSNNQRNGLSVLIDTLMSRDNQLVIDYNSSGKMIISSGISQIMTYLENSSSKVKIEGRSQLSVLDGQPAMIKSGERRAVITDTQTDGVSVRSSYKYVDIGLNLSVDIMPGSCDDFAVLKIFQSADNVTGYTYISGDEIPVIAQRSLNTSVRVDLGETVVLGGLTQDNIIKRNSGIPLLRSLPFIGGIFSNMSEEKISSDLIIVLQPFIPREKRSDLTNRSYSKFQKIQKDF